MDKKKIIIVGTSYPYRGGLTAFNEHLARVLTSEGHEVEIYTFTLQYPDFLFPGKTQYSDGPAPTDLKIIRRINSINPFNWLKVGKEIRRKRPDVLITKFWLPYMAPCLGTIERQVRKNKHTLIVSILDNLIPHEKRLGDKFLVKYFVKSTDKFVAMSKSVLSDLSLFDTKKPRVFCPHPLYDNYGELLDKDEAKKLIGLEHETHYVLFFGIIRDYKGLDLLLESFADSRFKDLNVKLLVAGEFYSNEEKYTELIHKLNIGERLHLNTFFIPDCEVNRYFSACDIVAQPYRTATQSGVTQIAFHFLKPMLVTNVGGLAEIVPDGKIGYVVEPDVKQITEALVDYFHNDREAEFSENITEEKKKYAWSNMTAAVLND